ncbi:MAG: hypothetical protein U5L96_20260 [Owenweeksia sp.]|nr:hypothetical protein [Owenweeksia sp.]
MKNRGYYQFNEDYLIFDSDTNQYEERYYDLYLDMKQKVPREDQIPYRINKVFVYRIIRPQSYPALKTIHFYWRILPTSRKRSSLNPNYSKNTSACSQEISTKKRLADLTTRRLSSLGIYQYASLRFDVVDSLQTDSIGYLNASVLLTPGSKYNLRAGMNGTTKSTGFAGPGVYVSYQNRNLFHGGEVLEVGANLGYEFQIARGRSRGLNNFELKLENSRDLSAVNRPLL